MLLFAAERIAPETQSYFADQDETTGDIAQNHHRGGEYTLGLGKTEGWGEKYSQQSALLDLFCVHTGTGNIERIDNVPGANDRETTLAGFTLGQAVWSPDGKSVVYIAWDAGGGEQMPRRLGLIYCMQRPSRLCWSRVEHLLQRLSEADHQHSERQQDAQFQVLTPDIRVCRSPRFAPVGDDGSHQLVFLAAERPFESHFGCFGLSSVCWKVGQPVDDSYRLILPQVWDPATSGNGCTVSGLPFPGLFTVELPEKCFVSSQFALISTQWGSCQKLVRISMADGNVDLVRVGDELASTSLLAISPDGSAFISLTASNDPHSIYHAPASLLLSKAPIDASMVARLPDIFPFCASRFSLVKQPLSLGFTYDVHTLRDIPRIEGSSSDITVQSILLLPNQDRHPRPAVIVVPHGGPHSASSTAYVPSSAYLCGYGGYAILLVNYRGSAGFGQASVEALPSKCGDMDVKDVIAATEQLKSTGLVDSDRIGICGGSHGGFLVAHCTAQYPDYFKAAAMRNPVVNIAR
jgi:acylaminoacyl-peptidase